MNQIIIKPIVHLNGTSLEELIRVREDFLREVIAARRALQATAPHLRDYYPVPGLFERALAQHKRRTDLLDDLIDEFDQDEINFLYEKKCEIESRKKEVAHG
jgi:hypothetical protein